MGGIRRKPRRGFVRSAEPVERTVEHLGQAGDFVARRGRGQALVRLVGADALRHLGDPGHRRDGLFPEPQAAEEDDQRHARQRGERAGEQVAAQILQRVERHADPERVVTAAEDRQPTAAPV